MMCQARSVIVAGQCALLMPSNNEKYFHMNSLHFVCSQSHQHIMSAQSIKKSSVSFLCGFLLVYDAS